MNACKNHTTLLLGGRYLSTWNFIFENAFGIWFFISNSLMRKELKNFDQYVKNI